ncbi:MAG: hypothetical protein FWE32_07405 [Oscillospiraceae bacterium]|nr:hypothetical protein [Oscillospiraceae bacterium]
MIFGDSQNNNLAPDILAIRQSANLYALCMCNPLKFADRTGQAAQEIRCSRGTDWEGVNDLPLGRYHSFSIGGQVVEGIALALASAEIRVIHPKVVSVLVWVTLKQA